MLAFGVMSVLLSIMIIGVSLLVIGLVLLQKNRGSGLSGAFGGVGGHSAFGTKTGDFLTWITVGLVGLFLLLNVVANYAFEPEKLDRTKAAPTPADTTSETIPPASGDAPATGTPTPVSTTPVPVSTTPSPAPATTPPAETPAAPAATPPAGESAPAGGTPPTSN